MSVIQVSGLVKNFGNFQALAGLNMSVEEGTVHGFLGPNGAGKSTTIRTLLGLLHPTAGKVRVLGKIRFNTQRFYVVSAMFLARLLSGLRLQG